ncbi:MAG TPA: Fe-S metabolism protein SufE [Flavobacteriales bacterium]|jgi:cysteine desulfuration protein SufE|nr:Fe-S metabolism protein SufE [Flavobacteriales bacterium]
MPSNHPLIESRQQEVIEDFSVFDDWMDKYEHLIDLGKDVPTIDDARKTDEHLIKGCQSRVWLAADETEDGGVVFTADSDAIITKGLVGLMVRVLSNAPAQAIAEADLHFLDAIGLHQHLSPTRSNGLASMVQQMRLYAAALAARQS